ncbi:MAG: glycosyltransferase family 4 protein [Acidimicrobiales bacterium]
MRIALIAPPWVAVPPPAYGGIESVLDGLSRGLVAAGHDVLLFTTGDNRSVVPTRWVLERASGVENFAPATEITHVAHAYEAAKGFDIVHDHTLCGPLYSRWVTTPPIVTTNHGPFDSELGDLYRAISDDIAVIAISQHQASLADGVRVAAVIHHGIDVDAVPFGAGDGGYALSLGRMCEDKGVHVAARIARDVGMPLLIAAKLRDPKEHIYFNEQVAPLLGGGVEFVGEVGGAAKTRLLAGAGCLLNPLSWPEPFGMVMIEALACGTPVVSTPVGSVPEIVDDGITGFLRATEDELAAALLKVDDLDRAACRSAARERFSTDRMVAAHVALYESIITNN